MGTCWVLPSDLPFFLFNIPPLFPYITIDQFVLFGAGNSLVLHPFHFFTSLIHLSLRCLNFCTPVFPSPGGLSDSSLTTVTLPPDINALVFLFFSRIRSHPVPSILTEEFELTWSSSYLLTSHNLLILRIPFLVENPPRPHVTFLLFPQPGLLPPSRTFSLKVEYGLPSLLICRGLKE